MVPWHAPKAKVQLRLATQRLRMLQEKKLALAKQSRRDIADLVTKGRIETARLRVETLIGDDIHVELLEIIELYTETLLARFALLDASKDAPDPSLMDAVCALIFAAPHTELKELHLAREMLMHKFGRAFALQVINNDPVCVPTRVSSKLSIYVPPPELVDRYLQEIARGYGIVWTSDRLDLADAAAAAASGDREEEKQAVSGDEDSDSEGGGMKEAPILATEETTSASVIPTVPDPNPWESKKLMDDTKKSIEKEGKQEDDFAALTARFDALKKR